MPRKLYDFKVPTPVDPKQRGVVPDQGVSATAFIETQPDGTAKFQVKVFGIENTLEGPDLNALVKEARELVYATAGYQFEEEWYVVVRYRSRDAGLIRARVGRLPDHRPFAVNAKGELVIGGSGIPLIVGDRDLRLSYVDEASARAAHAACVALLRFGEAGYEVIEDNSGILAQRLARLGRPAALKRLAAIDLKTLALKLIQAK